MILGIGTDLANIDRIQGVLSRHGDRFRNRVFTKRNKPKPHDGKMKLGLMQNAGLQKKPVLKRLALV